MLYLIQRPSFPIPPRKHVRHKYFLDHEVKASHLPLIGETRSAMLQIIIFCILWYDKEFSTFLKQISRKYVCKKKKKITFKPEKEERNFDFVHCWLYLEYFRWYFHFKQYSTSSLWKIEILASSTIVILVLDEIPMLSKNKVVIKAF